MRRLRFFFAALVLAALILGAAGFVPEALAQTVHTDGELFYGGISGSEFAELAGLSSVSLPVAIARIIRTIISLLGIVAVGFIIYGGFLWMASGGEATKVEKAQKTLINAVIGLAIVLASFAIAQFIISRLVTAVGGGGLLGGGPGSGSGFGPDYSSPTRQFVLRSASTECAETIRNLDLTLVFSHPLRAMTVEEGTGITIQKVGDTTIVPGEWIVRGARATFTPSAACPAPNADENCFEANTDYQLTAYQSVVRSNSGAALNCTLTYPCTFTFHTGTGIDEDAPALSITAPDEGQSVFTVADEPWQVFGSDDTGVVAVDFSVDGDLVEVAGLDASSVGDVASENLFSGVWPTAGYLTNRLYEVSSTGVDCAGHVAESDAFYVMMRAANCANGVQDSNLGETGVDCGGDRRVETYCGACAGEACTTNDDCESGECVDGICVASPLIQEVSPASGAAGSLVSVLGSGFGTTPGFVWFLGDPENADDDVKIGPTEMCTDTWKDDQVVVEQITNVQGGPVMIMSASGETDRTDDERGPLLSDYAVSSVVHPGMCSITPSAGSSETPVAVQGDHFGDGRSDSLFYVNQRVANLYPGSWSDGLFNTVIPVLSSGKFFSQLFVTQDATRVESNRLWFRVQDSATSLAPPQIDDVDSGLHLCSTSATLCQDTTDCPSGEVCEERRDFGPKGQYVTVYGSGFGSRVGTVRLRNQTTEAQALGDRNFPDACGDGLWTDTALVFKVPVTYSLEDPASSLAAGLHDVWVTRADDGASSNLVGFTVTNGQAGANICAIDPAAGPVGTDVEIFGERLGAGPGEVVFSQDRSVTPGEWNSDSIRGTADRPLEVPTDAQTGPVYVQETTGFPSNSLPFAVGICNRDFVCEAGLACCGDGACRVSCEDAAVHAHYAWHFSTGDLPVRPSIVAACGSGVISPTPWIGYDGGTEVCSNAVVSATFTTAMDRATITADSFRVDLCSDQTCDEVERVEIDASAYPMFATTTYGVDSRVTWGPQGGWVAGSWYQVTILGDEDPAAPRSLGGLAMENDYAWRFHTAESGAPCTVGGILVSPSQFTATTQNQGVGYTAEPIADEYQCTLLACLNYQWNWASDEPTRAPVAATAASCQATVTAEQETAPGDPAHITAALASPAVVGSGTLVINYADPEVAEVWPNCDEACINGAIGARFTVDMSPNFDGFDAAGQPLVRLYQCQNEVCSGPLTLISGRTLSYSVAQRTLTIDPDAPLLTNTYYRVLISGQVTSTSGVPLSLSGANSGSDYAWIFRTRETDEPCVVDQVVVEPAQTVAHRVGERAVFEAVPFGPPDACSSNGQRLSAEDVSWNTWTAQDEPDEVETADVADLFEGGAIALSTATSSASCTADCLRAGSPAGISICGNNAISCSTSADCPSGQSCNELGQCVEFGEDCDDGNDDNADGCSSICLTEGVAACTSTVTVNCCGNGSREGREECDDENNQNSDGCSAVCLNEGSVAVSTVIPGVQCGSGSVIQSEENGGEECDQSGNVAGGDGCSAVCLNEGSVPEGDVYAVCGNGTLEAGEDCDDGDAEGGDLCSPSCLWEGRSACTSLVTTNCCGNGTSEYGEGCDDGNTQSEDGCSASCVLEGSSIAYETISICGDGVIGEGEACEASAANTALAPFAVAEILNQAPLEVVASGTNEATSEITASVLGEDVSGSAAFTLACSCTNDALCGDATAVGCGTGSCCFDRPTLTSIQPTGSNVCRNAAIWADFDQLMDARSFAPAAAEEGGPAPAPNAYLELTATSAGPISAATCPTTQGYILFDTAASSASAPSSWVSRLMSWVREQLPSVLAQTIIAPVTGGSPTVSCRLPLTFTLVPLSDGASRVSVAIPQLLEPNANYRFVVEGDSLNPNDDVAAGVVSINDVGLYLGSTQTFQTGAELCALEAVGVEDFGLTVVGPFDDPSVGLFTVSGETHNLLATPYTIRGAETLPIQSIPGVYAWSWSGTDPATSASWGWSSSVAAPGDIISAQNLNSTQVVATAVGENGSEQVFAQARITDDVSIPSTVGTTVRGSVALTAFLCENPWPAPADFPYTQEDYTFSFGYCRDAGEVGLAEDLPGASVVEVAASPNTLVVYEALYPITGTPDAIGVRITENDELLPPMDWYRERGFRGSPTLTTVDGFEAVRDGNTYYVSAVVEDGSSIQPYIYAISINASAGAEATAIFEQVLANWRFVVNDDVVTDHRICTVSETNASPLPLEDGSLMSCSVPADCTYVLQDGVASPCDPEQSDVCLQGYCDAEKTGLRRDVRRLADARRIEQIFEAYGEAHGHCSVTRTAACVTDGQCPGTETCEPDVPTIAAGSFVRSFTTSVWPSWSGVLGQATGELPADPVNAFGMCPEGADPVTCWDASAAEFTCPANGSSVYIFQSSGGDHYDLYTQLEYPGSWAVPLDTSATDNHGLHAEGSLNNGNGFSSAPLFCNGIAVGSSLVCGDGVIGIADDPATPVIETEICELGEVTASACTTTATSTTPSQSGLLTAACINDGGVCRFQTEAEAETAGSVCVPNDCGNGVVEAGEDCDDGALNGQYGFCGANCLLTSAVFCGDGYLAGGEACDCGDSISDLADLGSWANAHCWANNGQYALSSANACAFNCTTPGPSCGDGVVNGPEFCDNNVETSALALCGAADGFVTCSASDPCPTTACGDGGASCGTSQICQGGISAGAACTTDADCSGGLCSSATYQLARTRTCDDDTSPTCTWNPWSACVGGLQVCGNGDPEGTEACDDGNGSSNDDCTNLCTVNVCGDGFVYVGVESCDNGVNNGTACVPGYDSTCSYCSAACQYITVSGAYCGDNTAQTGEFCDGSDTPMFCYKGASDPRDRDVRGLCEDDSDCAVYGSGYSCKTTGICNGGVISIGSDFDVETIYANGYPCAQQGFPASPFTTSSYACGATPQGECVYPTCQNDCQSSCPFTLLTTSVLVQEEPGDQPPTSSVELASYQSGDEPDTAALILPACQVSSSVTADINMGDRELPDLDVVFVTTLDTTNSDATRVNMLQEAMSDLYGMYENTGADLRVALVSATTEDLSGSDLDGDGQTDDDACKVDTSGADAGDGLAWVDYPFTNASGQGGLLYDPAVGVASLLSREGGYLPSLAAGVDCAVDLHEAEAVASADDRRRVVVVTTQFDPMRSLEGEPCGFSTLPQDDCNDQVYAISDLAEDADDPGDLGVEFFYVGFDEWNDIAVFRHFSSDVCENSSPPAFWDDIDDCTTGVSGIEYAYDADDGDDPQVFYDTIRNVLVGSQLVMSMLVDTDSNPDTEPETIETAQTIIEGLGIPISLPPSFVCEISGSQTIPFHLAFEGAGSIELSNVRLLYCPVP